MSWTDENSVLKDLKLFLIFKIPEQPRSYLAITELQYSE